VSGAEDKSESTRITLLADIRTAFELKKVDRLRSADLATHLATLDDRRWPEFRHGKPITQAQIANLLKELRIKPGTIRIGQETPKGYMKADFEDVFERLPPPREPPHRHKPWIPWGFGRNRAATKSSLWQLGKCPRHQCFCGLWRRGGSEGGCRR